MCLCGYVFMCGCKFFFNKRICICVCICVYIHLFTQNMFSLSERRLSCSPTPSTARVRVNPVCVYLYICIYVFLYYFLVCVCICVYIFMYVLFFHPNPFSLPGRRSSCSPTPSTARANCCAWCWGPSSRPCTSAFSPWRVHTSGMHIYIYICKYSAGYVHIYIYVRKYSAAQAHALGLKVPCVPK